MASKFSLQCVIGQKSYQHLFLVNLLSALEIAGYLRSYFQQQPYFVALIFLPVLLWRRSEVAKENLCHFLANKSLEETKENKETKENANLLGMNIMEPAVPSAMTSMLDLDNNTSTISMECFPDFLLIQFATLKVSGNKLETIVTLFNY